MTDYTTMHKPELQDLCRQRELPVSGTVEELVARLSGWDAANDPDDLLTMTDVRPPEGAVTAEPDEAPPPAPDPTPARVAPTRAYAAPAPPDATVESKVFEQLYECHGALPTELHMEWIERTAQAARDAGVATRGGAYRNGYRMKGGKRYAVYEITRART